MKFWIAQILSSSTPSLKFSSYFWISEPTVPDTSSQMVGMEIYGTCNIPLWDRFTVKIRFVLCLYSDQTPGPWLELLCTTAMQIMNRVITIKKNNFFKKQLSLVSALVLPVSQAGNIIQHCHLFPVSDILSSSSLLLAQRRKEQGEYLAVSTAIEVNTALKNLASP